jgi:hypothetical protein
MPVSLLPPLLLLATIVVCATVLLSLCAVSLEPMDFCVF